MGKQDYVNVQLHRDIHARLKKRAEYGESMNSIVTKLLEQTEPQVKGKDKDRDKDKDKKKAKKK